MEIDELYNKEAEENIIAICLTSQEKLGIIVNELSSQDFFDRQLRIIFENIQVLAKKGKQVDIVTLTEQLRFSEQLEQSGGKEKLQELIDNLITVANYKQLIKIIIKYSKKRFLSSILKECEGLLEKQEDVDDVLKYIENTITTKLLSKTTTNLNSLASGFMDVIDEVEKVVYSKDKIFGLSTGFPKLDKTLSGLCKGRLYIIGARARVGKSSLAQQIAEYVAQDHNVLFHSLEMKVSQYTKRSVFRRAKINNDMISNANVKDDVLFDKIASVGDSITNLNLFIDDNTKCTLSTVEKNIIKMQQDKGSCDLVVIDYIQLMQSDNKYQQDRREKIGDISTGLKRLALKYDVPIIALAQLSRALEARPDKRPILSDLKESGDLEQDADVVIGLYRDEIYNPHNKGTAELIVLKNREGACRVIPYYFNGSVTEFMEVKE